MNNIVIYTKKYCPYCDSAKGVFQREGWEYEEKVLTTTDEFENLKNKTGLMTVPQIFVNNELIGGYDDLINKIDHVRTKLNKQ